MKTHWQVATALWLVFISQACSTKRNVQIISADRVPKSLVFKDGDIHVMDFDPSGKPIEVPKKSVNGFFAVSPTYLDELAKTLKECSQFQNAE